MTMRGYPLAVGAFALMVGAAGLVPAVTAATPAAAQIGLTAAAVAPADSAGSLYVSPCSLSGDGSQATPFCTLAEAAAAVQPGQTVLVEPGRYEEALNITRSGTAGAPITFVADNHHDGSVMLNASGTLTGVPPISVSGAHDVVVRGFAATARKATGIEIDSSSDVTIDQGFVSGSSLETAVHVSGSSSRVTISRIAITGSGSGILVDTGTASVTVTGNDIAARSAIVVLDSPQAKITSNTVIAGCSVGITLSGDSPSASLENNIVETSTGTLQSPAPCKAPASATGISVSPGSAAQTTAAYNLIDPTSGAALYSWAGIDYTELSAFATASGQGAHDIAADPQLSNEPSQRWQTLDPGSPAIDSADLNAPGEIPTDMFDNGRANDPAAADTGTGIDYADRGAVERVGPVSMGGANLVHRPGGGPLDSIASASLRPDWAHTGPIGLIDFTSGASNDHQVSHATSASHTFSRAGLNCLTAYESLNGFRTSAGAAGTDCWVFGTNYTALPPTRILDTNHAIGVPTTTALKAHGTLTLPVSGVGSLPASKISALVLNLTVTNPASTGILSVYAAGTGGPAISALTFNAHQTRSNLVTVPLTTGISIHSSSAAAVQISADLEGYYSNLGSGFKPTNPVRVLDTRTGTGAAAHSLARHATLDLNLSSRIPTTATAVVLAVAMSGPTATGGVSVYATGTPRPAALNLSFVKKASGSNLVISRVSKGHVSLYNSSAGPIHLTADLSGYFGPGATQAFVPYGQPRILDTGTTPIKAHGQGSVRPSWLNDGCSPACPLATASVLNLTVTQAKASGTVIGYPTGTRPNTSSLSFTAGQPVSNLATLIAPTSGIYTVFYNNSTGTARILVDEQGYYIASQ
jgi:hypothetical protein